MKKERKKDTRRIVPTEERRSFKTMISVTKKDVL